MIIKIALIFVLSLNAYAECVVRNSDGSLALPKADKFYQSLQSMQQCPASLNELKNNLRAQGYTIKASMVANRGRGNSSLGSFSLFEMVSGLGVEPGSWFFGHFTDAHNKKLFLDQKPAKGKLLIELLVWDDQKQVFNFYEWIGTENSARWFYRGDSFDALSDNKFIHRNVPEGEQKFGNRMRCSACHSSGGPIMKELAFPQNDWWSSSRILPLTPNAPTPELSQIINNLSNADELSSWVRNGIQKLEQSSSYSTMKKSLFLQERLRPVFCENEINLESDSALAESSIEHIEIPSDFFVNNFLASKKIIISTSAYKILLDEFAMRFPETNLQDADHAWLTPVKAYSDKIAVQTLLSENLIDHKFAAAVYSVDKENPILSDQRCALLKLVPQEFSPTWLLEFISNLKKSKLDSAKELAHNLESQKTIGEYEQEALTYFENVKALFETDSGRKFYFQKLINLRQKVFTSEISQNPRGQILEPGFRVIFPKTLTSNQDISYTHL